MIFASLSFIFLLLPLFLLGDRLLSKRSARLRTAPDSLSLSLSLRNSWLLVLSLIFYVWGEPAAVFLLVALGLINYGAGILIRKSLPSKLWLTVFVCLNLAVLVGFKYAYWLLSLLVPLGGHAPSLPLGISFFTFHAVSYLVDIYRRQIEPARSALQFLTYFCMFPHLVAGPIVRYAQVREDLASRGPDRDLFAFGAYRFLVGLNKKVLIANSVSLLADSAFLLSSVGQAGVLDAWLGILAYTVQIYFDFSGYSDMAIGLAAMAGFRFEENFRRPYSSASIREFWRRWHISLSSWLRDYLYIPMGGSRAGTFKTYRNLLLVFFVCGLWHGANVTFVIWGLWHGAFLVMERLFAGRLSASIPRLLGRAYALFVVILGWVFFRAENIQEACAYFGALFTPSSEAFKMGEYTFSLCMLGLGLLLCLLPDRWFPAPESRSPKAFPAYGYALQFLLAVLSVAALAASTRNPFIYFNF